jgi:hypothetical protein
MSELIVKGVETNVMSVNDENFFISDWLRNRNTVEF